MLTITLVGLAALLTTAAQPFTLPSLWVHGAKDEPALQVHEAADGFWILRQSKRTHFEGPFMYLLAGNERALLLDTGAVSPFFLGPPLPLRGTVDRLLAEHASAHELPALPLVVAHSHGHQDHIGGDAQFADRKDTVVVGPMPEDVAAFFGLDQWPDGTQRFDLGARVLTILPLPGHQPAHIAVYDANTRTLLTGDTLYPGLITVRDRAAFKTSAAKLATFVHAHEVDRVLGAHIEMSSIPDRMYAIGTAFQPDEHALALTSADVDAFAAAAAAMADIRHDEMHGAFALTQVLPPSTDKASTHGMLLVGTDTLFVSHLPMFHSPHDYQLIAEVTLPNEPLEAYRRDATEHPDELYTIAPTKEWVLPNVIAVGASFDVDVYRGHFERGGTKILDDVPVKVTRLVHFRRFEAGTPRSDGWIAFGGANESFLAHRIESAPDFDQVVELERTSAGAVYQPPRAVTPLSVGDKIGSATVRRVIYTEHGDLKD